MNFIMRMLWCVHPTYSPTELLGITCYIEGANVGNHEIFSTKTNSIGSANEYGDGVNTKV